MQNKFLRNFPRHLFIYFIYSGNNKICPLQKSMFQTIIFYFILFSGQKKFQFFFFFFG